MTRSQVSKRTAMVKAELAARGLSLSKIAAELEVGRAVVSLVLRGKRRSARIEQRLASAIGIEPASLWGDTAAAVLPTNTPGCASIKAQLQLKGWTFTALASTLNVSPSAIARVVHGESRSEKIETRIALLLMQERKALWPKWHGAPQLRLHWTERQALAAQAREKSDAEACSTAKAPGAASP